MSGPQPAHDFDGRFDAFAKQHALVTDGDTVVVGVSGGVDSVCLLDLLRRRTSSLQVVHVNYGFRGEGSDRDEQLVHDMCIQHSIPFVVHRADKSWRQEAASHSLQEAARDLRYRVMMDVARSAGSKTVAVAHNLDDQAETVLLRLIRGTGAFGLAAMQPRRALQDGAEIMLVRPLLFASRAEIVAYARDQNLSYRDDPSNLDERFDRARIRTTVLPAITAAFGDASIKNIAAAAERQQALLNDDVIPILDADLEACVDVQPDGVHLALESLIAMAPGRRRLVLLRALQRYLPDVPHRSSVIERTESLIAKTPGKRLRLDAGTIWRARRSIVLVPVGAEERLDAASIQLDVRNETAFGSIVLEHIDPMGADLSDDLNSAVVDGSVLDRPLSLGPWLPGERFQPLGFSGTKKVSDFLTDVKVPTYVRASVPVLRSGPEIVWIPGYRLAHPFRLTRASTSAVRITFESAR